MSNLNNSKSENKFKKLRNKDSYISAFLERRKKAADFAIKDKNKSKYEYKAPLYIMKSEEEILELKKKKKKQNNSDRNKSDFYKTYNTLKNSITQKNNKTSNNSSLNKINIEKENNKYYLSKEKKLEKKKNRNNKQNLGMISSNNIETNNKYNNVKLHTIKVTSESIKNDEEKNPAGRNNSWKDLQIQRTSSINNYEFVDDKKKEKEIEISPEPCLETNNKYEYKDYLYNKHKNDNYIPIKKEKEINEIINKYKNKNIYNDELNYESTLDKNKLVLNYKNDMIIENKVLENHYYPKNMSEPHNLFEKTKNIYSLKETKSSNILSDNSSNIHHKPKNNDISPIRINYPNEMNNKNLERNYENQTQNANGINKNENNTQLSYNIKLVKENNNNNDNMQNKNKDDLNKEYYKKEKSPIKYDDKITNDFKRKMKNAGILYDNEKYYIDDLEIPKLSDDYYKKNNKRNRNSNSFNNNRISENNYINKKMNNENQLLIQKNKENDIQILNDLKSENKLNDLMKEHDILSQEQKTEKIDNNNNNDYNSNIPQEKNNNNNNKIKNIKTQSFKKSDGHKYESIKEKFESFLKPKEDKEPNIQSKVINSLLSSKEDMNNNNNIGNNNKSLVKNIQEKIKILKDNKNKIQNGKEYNYINEIDECYNKIKSKEEKDNIALEKYYTELQQKENENENNNAIRIKDIKNLESENPNKNDNKKTKLIQKSKRLEYIIRNILNNKKYNYVDYHYLSNKINRTKSKTKENLDINCMNIFGQSTPDINLIADQSNDEYIKLIDENYYNKFRNKNLRSVRTNYNLSKNESNNKIINYRSQSVKKNKSNNYKYFSPRLLIKENSHKIMPPNELIF